MPFLSLDSEIRSDRPLQRIGAHECLNRKAQTVANSQSLSVIFPAFNEEANIRSVVEDACRIIPKFAPIFEIIVVNDGSRDRTAEICDDLALEFSTCVLFIMRGTKATVP